MIEFWRSFEVVWRGLKRLKGLRRSFKMDWGGLGKSGKDWKRIGKGLEIVKKGFEMVGKS